MNPGPESRISRAFLVKKGKEGGVQKYRLCVDLRRVNRHLKKVGLRYERLRDFGHLLSKNDFLVGFDIRNAYHHLRVPRQEEHFLQFRMGEEVFACRALPFGLSLSPYYFTQLMLVVGRFLRSPGSCAKGARSFRFGRLAGNGALQSYVETYTKAPPAILLAYLDDFLASMSDETKLREWAAKVRAVFDVLGLQFKEQKCQWTPVRRKRHLGVVVDTVKCRFEVPLDKAAAITSRARELRSRGWVVARDLARFCGLGVSLSLAFPLARFFLMNLYRVLRTKRSWRDRLRLPAPALLDLEAWINIRRCEGRPLNPDAIPFAGTVATDASLTGWGATYTPPRATVPLLARGFFDRSLRHINVRELQAVELALRSFFPGSSHGMSRRLRLLVDNQVVMYCLRSMTTGSKALLRPLRQLQRVCETRALLLDPTYIPSADNTLPDKLSRVRVADDYRLDPTIFRSLEAQFGKRTIDRFASRANSLCPRFNTLHADVDTESIDAFLQNWAGEANWCNPPWHLLPRLSAFLAARPEVEAVVVAPDWPSSLWFPTLRNLARAERLIPRRVGMFLPGDPTLPRTLPPPKWNLRAFHICPRNPPPSPAR